MSTRRTTNSLLIIAASLISALAFAKAPKNKPVPDERTAIQIAETALTKTHGKSWVEHHGPYQAKLKNDAWIVTGTYPPGQTGGEVVIVVDQRSGKTKEIDMQ